jgi:hypothetical protein
MSWLRRRRRRMVRVEWMVRGADGAVLQHDRAVLDPRAEDHPAAFQWSVAGNDPRMGNSAPEIAVKLGDVVIDLLAYEVEAGP